MSSSLNKYLHTSIGLLGLAIGPSQELHLKLNSVTWVCERTISTERPPLVGEVSANLYGYRVSRGRLNGSPRLYSRVSRPEPLLFLSSSSSVVLTRLSGPRSRPTTSQKIWKRRESNPDLWICSHKLWPLDHRGGQNSSSEENNRTQREWPHNHAPSPVWT
jgi:hypothetical protein